MSSSRFVTQRMRRILVFGLVAALGVPAAARAHELPDLIADPPENPMLDVDADESGEERLLLRFDGHVHNQGTGPLEVTRRKPASGESVVEQILRGGVTPATRFLAPESMKFEDTDGHNHWHLQRIARYSLYDPTGTAPVAPVMKVGFCLIDSTRVTGTVQPAYHSFCQAGNRDPELVRMGVSSGWRDLYARNLPFQYVDVSETQPGTYRLRSEIDPENLVEESDEVNVPGETTYAVPGYGAMIGDADPAGGTAALALAGNAHGTGLGARRFKIVSGPEHGTLTRPTGEWFTEPGVTYTPTGAAAPDRFAYVADDAASDYPRHPGRATVLLGQTGAERVAMWGVPEKLRAGMTVDLSAQVFEGATNVVTWTVTGGGAIDQGGRYTAPAAIPAGGRVTVTATGPGGVARDAMDIQITEPPPAPAPAPRPGRDDVPTDSPRVSLEPSPSPSQSPTPALAPAAPRGTTKPPTTKRTPIGSVRLRRIGPQYTIAVVSRSTGRVRASLMQGRRRLATCTVRVRARRSALCRLRVRSGATAIALTLVRRDGRIERRRLLGPGPRA